MTKKIILIFILTVTLDADIIDFYKKALASLRYNQEYMLNKKANTLTQSGVKYSKYANFTLDAEYSKTKAKRLANTFNTSNITFNDTLDLFAKNSYKIDRLRLDLKSQKSLLNIQKEQLFISLVNMIAIYTQTFKQLSLYKRVLHEQKKIYNKLQKLQQQGAITSIDVLRFKNQLTSLQMKIINQKNKILTMKKQLHLYAPNQQIPTLKSSKLLHVKKEFLAQDPQLNFNSTEAQKLLLKAQGLNHSYLPDVTAGATYQQDDDPTANGDNYSFLVGITLPLDAGNFKEEQALKVKALSLKSKNIQYKIERKNEYIRRYQAYINATEQLKLLDTNSKEYEESEKSIQTAYLRQYVDFNTYIQVIMQTLHIKAHIIQLQSQKSLEATILNSIASGIIYE